MKNFDSRTYSINDFLEWHDNGQLQLSPRFQRRSVWTDQARSYLSRRSFEVSQYPKSSSGKRSIHSQRAPCEMS